MRKFSQVKKVIFSLVMVLAVVLLQEVVEAAIVAEKRYRLMQRLNR